jgi:hypothetical protein
VRFRSALKKGVEGIIEAGRVLIEAKATLDHGQFSDWVVSELRHGAAKPGSREADIRKAQILMFVARNDVLSNPSHWHALPPSPRTLYELTQIHPKRLLKLIDGGKIHPGTTREEAIGFQPKEKSAPKAAALKLKDEVATLLNVCILLGQADCVLAHIRGLKRARRDLTMEMFDQAVRWAKPKLARQAGAE